MSRLINIVTKVAVTVANGLKRFGRWVLPSLPSALKAKPKIDKLVQQLKDGELDQSEVSLEGGLYLLSSEGRHHSVSMLLALHEADQARIRGLEAKALAVLQLLGLVFAGNLAALALTLSNGNVDNAYALFLTIVSLLYLLSALVATLMVARPGVRYTLDASDILPITTSARLLTRYTRQNRAESLNRSNFTQSALDDATRALVLVMIALAFAIW